MQNKIITQNRNNIGFLAQNIAEPSNEVIEILRQQGVEYNEYPWFAIPALVHSRRAIKFANIRIADALKLLEAMLKYHIINQTLRTIDVFNGCNSYCDTCLADTGYPSSMFSLTSLEKLFSNSHFLQSLAPDSLRIGSAGDVLNHPQAIEIVTLVL